MPGPWQHRLSTGSLAHGQAADETGWPKLDGQTTVRAQLHSFGPEVRPGARGIYLTSAPGKRRYERRPAPSLCAVATGHCA